MPDVGNFYLLSRGTNRCPLPFLTRTIYEELNCPVYFLGPPNSLNFLVDDTTVVATRLALQQGARDPPPFPPDDCNCTNSPGDVGATNTAPTDGPTPGGPLFLMVGPTNGYQAWLFLTNTEQGACNQLESTLGLNSGLPWQYGQIVQDQGTSHQVSFANVRMDRKTFWRAVSGSPIVSIYLDPDYNFAVQPSVSAGDGITGKVNVAISQALASDLTVLYTVANDHCTNGVDYATLTDSVTIPAGYTAASMPVQPLPGAPFSPDRGVMLSLVLTNGYLVNPAASTANIKIYNPRPAGMAVAILDSGWTRYNAIFHGSWTGTNWNYFVMPESVKEALRSDGAPYVVLSDLDVANNALLTTNGTPKYPIVIAFATDTIREEEITPLADYVSAGGFVLAGSSAFTRNTDGTARTNFALTSQMGVSCGPSPASWYADQYLLKTASHVLVNDLPDGSLVWKMPNSADEISWGSCADSHDYRAPHLIWNVTNTTATILARDDYADPNPSAPYFTLNQYGSGYFIYNAAMQPLIGHGGFAPTMYAYMTMRRAIEWAFQSAQLPVARVSPWPFQYNAAFLVRHDLENFTNEFAQVSESAQYEQLHGVKGDYYLCTGAAFGNPDIIANIRQATNYGATIGPHNGGLPYPRLSTETNSSCFATPIQYIYFHWGLDEALDTPFGYDYALASLRSAFDEIDTWLGVQGPRVWCAPYFNGTREDSYRIQEQLSAKITGDQKLTPFPAFTISTQSDGKRYGILSQPVSDWFVFQPERYDYGLVAQSLEPWHPPGVHTAQTLRAGVSFYYTNGFLVNYYSHTLSTGLGDAGELVPDYISYCTDSNSYPRMWPANAVGLYQWWLKRGTVQIAATTGPASGNLAAMMNIAGAQDPDTAVDLVAPGSGRLSALQVATNGTIAGTNAYRLFNRSIKVLVGTTVTNVQVQYTNIPVPIAQDDFYATNEDHELVVSAPGVLANDFSGSWQNLMATNATTPHHGTLMLNADGGFTYAPESGFSGMDCFSYQATHGTNAFGSALVTIQVTQTNGLLTDDFTRCDGRLSPWVVSSGTWIVTNEVMQGTSPRGAYGYCRLTNSWTDYVVQARIQFPLGAFGGGLGARLDPQSGAHYAAWVYPEGSSAGSNVLKIAKFSAWGTWAPLAVTNLASVGTNWHTLRLAVQGSAITVNYDSQEITTTDSVLPAGVPSLDMWTDGPGPDYIMSVDHLSIAPLQ